MKKTLMAIILGMILISLVSAYNITAGECLEIDLSGLENLDNLVYDVIGNSSNTIGMNITFNATTKNASICFVVNYQPDSFTIIFIDNLTKEVIKEVHHYSSGGSSGGSSTKEVYIENKTIEYVEIDKYIDNTIYIEKEEKEEELIIDDSLIDKPSLPPWYWYLILVMYLILVIIGGIYFYIKRKNSVDEGIIIKDDPQLDF